MKAQGQGMITHKMKEQLQILFETITGRLRVTEKE